MMLVVVLFAIYWGINHSDRLVMVGRELGVTRWLRLFLSYGERPYESSYTTTKNAKSSAPSSSNYVRVFDSGGKIIRETEY